MKTKFMAMAILLALLTPITYASDDSSSIEYLKIRFLNGNYDLGQPNPEIYGDTDVTKYAPKIDLTMPTGEVICASANKVHYPLRIAIPKIYSSPIKAKITNAISMKKHMENARINTHLIIGDLFKDNKIYGNTVDLVFRMMG